MALGGSDVAWGMVGSALTASETGRVFQRAFRSGQQVDLSGTALDATTPRALGQIGAISGRASALTTAG